MNRVDAAVALCPELARCRELSLGAAARVMGLAPATVLRRVAEEDLFEGQMRRTPRGQYRVPVGAVLKAQGIEASR